MAMRKMAVLVVLVVALAGCAVGLVKSRVTAFHRLPGDVSGMRYMLVPTRSQAASLEYRRYADIVRENLRKRGMEEVSRAEDADVLVVISYAIDGGKVIRDDPIVIDRDARITGHVDRYGNFTGRTRGGPIVIGGGSSIQYERFFALDMLDAASALKGEIRKLYEGRVVSRGRSSTIAVVMPAMIRALFKNFPGKSGKTYVVMSGM